MSKLDCEWGEGLRFIESEKEALQVLKQNAGEEWNWLSCPKSSSTDYLATKNNQLKTLIEIKSRETFKLNKEKIPFTWRNFQEHLNGEYLVSEQKIKDNSEASRIFSIPFFLVINFLHEGFLLRLQITDKSGKIIIPFKEKTRTTQATSNGGIKEDKVYLIDTKNQFCKKIQKQIVQK